MIGTPASMTAITNALQTHGWQRAATMLQAHDHLTTEQQHALLEGMHLAQWDGNPRFGEPLEGAIAELGCRTSELGHPNDVTSENLMACTEVIRFDTSRLQAAIRENDGYCYEADDLGVGYLMQVGYRADWNLYRSQWGEVDLRDPVFLKLDATAFYDEDRTPTVQKLHHGYMVRNLWVALDVAIGKADYDHVVVEYLNFHVGEDGRVISVEQSKKP